MARIFISYRRDDASAEAGRLAADLLGRAGRGNVFIDVDSIGPAEDFEDRIDRALHASHVAFVLIGRQWLDAALPDGRRRLDQPNDYVRREITQALARPDVTVVPVLVDGADMPSVEQLPDDIAPLSKINAAELSHKRWRDDVRALWDVARRHDSFPRRLAYMTRVRALPLTVAAMVIAGAVAVAVLPGGGEPRSQGSTASSAEPRVPYFDGVASHLDRSKDFLGFLQAHDGDPVRLQVGFQIGLDDYSVDGFGSPGSKASEQPRIMLLTECTPPLSREEKERVDLGFASEFWPGRCMGVDLSVAGPDTDDSGIYVTHGAPRIEGWFTVDFGDLHQGLTGLALKPISPEQAAART
jgi:TIR domain